jgi:hypothetical protein
MGVVQGALEVRIEPLSDRYDPLDERWQDQARGLYVALKEEVGGVRKEAERAEGTKGGAEAIILALGSSGAFVAALEAFRAWLGRDRGRKLVISYEEGGQKKQLEVSGDGMDRATFQEIATAAAARAGEQTWAMESTGHS